MGEAVGGVEARAGVGHERQLAGGEEDVKGDEAEVLGDGGLVRGPGQAVVAGAALLLDLHDADAGAVASETAVLPPGRAVSRGGGRGGLAAGPARRRRRHVPSASPLLLLPTHLGVT